MKKIFGDEIYLRPITVEDTELIVKWRNEEFVKRNFIFRDKFTAEMHMNWLQTKVRTGEVIQYIVCKKNDEAIGSVYFRDVDLTNHSAEFGIFIGEESATGQGFGTDATRTFIHFGFECLDLTKIRLRVINENEKAAHVYQKVGFKKTFEEIQETSPLKEKVKVLFMEIEKN